jgi:iron complex transport system ATP-binding protein
MIEVKLLDIHLSGKTILNGLDLTFEQGKFHCIAGPNGSGKTTLLRSLTNVLKIKKKVIFIQKEDITTLSHRRLSKTVGLVPQSSPLDCDFSAYEIVMMGRSPHQSPMQNDSRQDIRIVKEAMDYTDVWHLRNMPVRVLSGGEKQRILIARALAQQTDILLLDEPVSYLDIQHQLEILNLLRRLNRERKITVIAVLHDLNHILNYAQVVYLLSRGELVAEGAPLDVLTPGNVRNVFSVDAYFVNNPLNGQNIMVTAELS